MIQQPNLLWDCWAPKALGSYMDIQSLWNVWEEGALVDGVGRGPPLRLVDAEWGWHKDKRTGKGTLPAWRPRNNETVSFLFKSVHGQSNLMFQARKRWSQFMSIVMRVQENISNGRTASEAVAELETLRDGQTLPQMQAALRPKGRKLKKVVKALYLAPEQSGSSSI